MLENPNGITAASKLNIIKYFKSRFSLPRARGVVDGLSIVTEFSR